jgi:nucleotide-binding universal stress UspA family protein
MDVLSLAGKRVRAVSIRNILLATDGSAGAHRALTAAADLSRRSGAALHLVTAYEFAPSSVLAYAPYIGPESAWDAFETDARKLLDNERGRLTALGASVDGMYVARDPAFNAVMDVAQTVDADLVVVGSRELDALRRTLVGSVSEHVVHSVHRPVLVVRGAASWPPAQILVGFDGSEGARGAAQFAATIAHLYDDSSNGRCSSSPRRWSLSPGGPWAPPRQWVMRPTHWWRVRRSALARASSPSAREGSVRCGGCCSVVFPPASCTRVTARFWLCPSTATPRTDRTLSRLRVRASRR